MLHIITAALAITVAATATHAPDPVTYARTARVVSIDYSTEVLTLQDGAGNLWQVVGPEDYDPGDLVSLLMDDNGTPDDVTDDVIHFMWYAGQP